jgi:hypothetical protein
MVVHPACVFTKLAMYIYTHIHICIHIVTTDPLNRDDFDVIIVCFSHLMMAQEGRNM